MNLQQFWREKYIYVITIILVDLLIFLLCLTFNINLVYVLIFSISNISITIIILNILYINLLRNYQKFMDIVIDIEQAEFSTHFIREPRHFESKYIYEVLKIVNQKMYLQNKALIDQHHDYEDYVNLWVHEAKILLQNIELNGENSLEMVEVIQMIDQLLLMSKLDILESDIQLSTVDIQELINNNLKKNFEIIYAHKLTINNKSNSHAVLADKEWLNFIISQLINNASKYAKSYINISIVEQNHFLILEIENDGQTISENEINKVWEKSYIGSLVKGNNKATGIGLYLVLRICEKLNYKIKMILDNNCTKLRLMIRIK